MPETFYHVRSAITGARVIIDLTDPDLAESERDRLNQEAATGIRAAYGEGDDHVPAQRLNASNTGHALATAGLIPAQHVGRILHEGQPMQYEIEEEHRLTTQERDEIAAQLAADQRREG
jgi:hypothetical protein